jgi:hypothetical protein
MTGFRFPVNQWKDLVATFSHRQNNKSKRKEQEEAGIMFSKRHPQRINLSGFFY